VKFSLKAKFCFFTKPKLCFIFIKAWFGEDWAKKPSADSKGRDVEELSTKPKLLIPKKQNIFLSEKLFFALTLNLA